MEKSKNKCCCCCFLGTAVNLLFVIDLIAFGGYAANAVIIGYCLRD